MEIGLLVVRAFVFCFFALILSRFAFCLPVLLCFCLWRFAFHGFGNSGGRFRFVGKFLSRSIDNCYLSTLIMCFKFDSFFSHVCDGLSFPIS
jgi:hypothetical protein